MINKAAVVGAGLMGSGIARHMASQGVQVTLVDTHEEQLARAARVNDNPDLQYTTDMATINAVDYVIEAVFENLDVKRLVLSQISSAVSPDCLIATNTSSLLIGDLEEAVTGPNRFIGVHYNNPADMNPVVEVIPGGQTETRHTDAILKWLRSTEKLAVKCKDTPCFILNRQSLPYINEASRCLNIATPGEIDSVVRNRLGIGLGPFAVMNLVGLPVMATASCNLEVLGTGYHAAPELQERSGLDTPDWDIEDVGDISKDKTSAIVKRLRGAMIFPGKDILAQGLCSRDDLHLICKEALGYDKSSPELLEMFKPAVTTELLEIYLSHQ
ncbi:MAG: 3-hydroxyacyl-CoA dehydrogenase family protein [Gammaproteobacteria bacterium]|jgi:3-hydroxybutyryl-CoA dehydrogenase|nr:3-hydroxyacyl-CoA dehydrogenase family protein [Gammaproteobacteria bacterium]MDG1231141.1 3-hydroxyacyl-CoA dehydrogenase family protein [Pseudomonadales bacterium]